ncbi:hypothetical protein ACFLQV_02015 [Calditrichota bacterium]
MNDYVNIFLKFLSVRSIIFGGLFFAAILTAHLATEVPSWVGLIGLLGVSLVISVIVTYLLAEQTGGFREMMQSYPIQILGIALAVLVTFISIAIMYYFAFFAGYKRAEVMATGKLIVPSWIVGYILFRLGGHKSRGI